MSNLKSEYKLLLFLGCFFIILLTIALIKYNVFETKITELKSKDYVKCTKEKINKGIEYVNYYCKITDDFNASYVVSYPEIKMNTSDVKKINRILCREYNSIINRIDYGSASKKFYLSDAYSLKYSIYNYENIVSIVITNESTVENKDKSYERKITHTVYNLDKNTGKIIDDNAMKNYFGFNLDLSSNLRMAVVKMYVLEHGYDYIGKIKYLRDKKIDNSVENVTYNNIRNIFIKDDGSMNFILYLYNPKLKRNIPYYYSIDDNKNITYEVKEK